MLTTSIRYFLLTISTVVVLSSFGLPVKSKRDIEKEFVKKYENTDYVKLGSLNNGQMTNAEKFDLCIKFYDKDSNKPEYHLDPIPNMDPEPNPPTVVCEFESCKFKAEVIHCPVSEFKEETKVFRYVPDFYIMNGVKENCYYSLRQDHQAYELQENGLPPFRFIDKLCV